MSRGPGMNMRSVPATRQREPYAEPSGARGVVPASALCRVAPAHAHVAIDPQGAVRLWAPQGRKSCRRHARVLPANDVFSREGN
jgi:hypothetical protein